MSVSGELGVEGPVTRPTGVSESKTGISPVQFDHAISYVKKVKSRFAQQPDIYHNFLEILQTCQSEGKSVQDVYAQIAQLLRSAPYLLDRFEQFLPESAARAAADTTPGPDEAAVIADARGTGTEEPLETYQRALVDALESGNPGTENEPATQLDEVPVDERGFHSEVDINFVDPKISAEGLSEGSVTRDASEYNLDRTDSRHESQEVGITGSSLEIGAPGTANNSVIQLDEAHVEETRIVQRGPSPDQTVVAGPNSENGRTEKS
ncbi:Transcriptional regulatory protein sin3 [Rhizina undulata]